MRKFITYADRILPVHHPRVVMETALDHGAPLDALLENTELTVEMLSSPDMRVSYAQYAMLSRNALVATGNAALGLHIGRNTGIGQMGVVGFLMQNSPTLGASLQALSRYSSTVTPGWEYQLDIREGTGVLTFRETISMEPLRRYAHEVMLAAFDTQTRTLYRSRPLPVRSLELPFPEPPHVKEYRDYFYDVPIRFERPIARLEFEAWILDERIPYADPATHKLAEQFCARLLPPDPTEGGLLGRVRHLLASETGPPPSFPKIAKTLQTSTRTLRRELQKMHTSYSELVDESRRVRAETWMDSTSMPIEQLATTLGFSTVGSFRRAYKRWTGRTPGAARARPH